MGRFGIVCLVLLTAWAGLAQEAFTVVERGRAAARIEVDVAHLAAARHAAEEFASYVEKMSGARLELCTNGVSIATGRKVDLPRKVRISGFKSNQPREVAYAYLSPQEVAISGSGSRALLYAVYDFLEREWGVRFYTEECEVVPKRDTLAVKAGTRYRHASPFERIGLGFCSQQFGAKVRMDWTGAEEKGGWPDLSAPFGSHNLGGRLLSPKKYFEQHPEWYALRGGKRTQYTQLCYSNPQVLPTIIDEIRQWAQSAKVNECRGLVTCDLGFLDNCDFCQCQPCAELVKKVGDHSGLALHVANTIASALESEFPHMTYPTLAYWGWEKPPAKPVPAHRNVYIHLCAGGNKALPIRVQPETKGTLEGWARICGGRLAIWGWDACFHNYYTPYPVYRLYGENARYFQSLRVRRASTQFPVKGISDFEYLRYFLYGRLGWDPDQDVDTLIRDWVAHVYGAGSKEVQAYIDTVRDQVWPKKGSFETTVHLHGYDATRNWFKPAALAKSWLLLRAALEKTKGDARAHHEVDKVYGGLLELLIFYHQETKMALAKIAPGKAFPRRLELVEEYAQMAKRCGAGWFRERDGEMSKHIEMLRDGTQWQ